MAEKTERVEENRRGRHQQELNSLRAKVATIVKIVFTVIALILAVGALLSVAGKHVSADNPLVKLIYDIDDFFDGPFSRHHGVFTFSGANREKLDALVNWGIAAIVYFVIGNILRRILQPSGTVRK